MTTSARTMCLALPKLMSVLKQKIVVGLGKRSKDQKKSGSSIALTDSMHVEGKNMGRTYNSRVSLVVT